MNYSQAAAYIASTGRFGSKPGLTVMQRMLEKMGEPQKKYKAVHITGTNGKGSTAAYVSNVLMRCGYRTGLFTSPPMFSELDRIRLDGINIPEEDFAEICEYIKELADGLEQEGVRYPTEFELYTLIAFEYFARSNVDIAVLEVGMGGRLDSTNVCDSAVSAITAVGLDHMQWLGDTLAQIAWEKAGIIRQGVPVVVYPEQAPEVLETIRQAAAEKNAPVLDAARCTVQIRECTIQGSVFDLSLGEDRLDEIRIAMVGEHQIKNCVTAVRVLLCLRDQGWRIGPDALRAGLAQTHWNGRFEVIRQKPLVILDGGHNRQCMEALAACVEQFLGGYEKILVFSMFEDKDYISAIPAIRGLFDRVIVAEMQHQRKARAEDLAALFSGDVQVKKDPAEAVAAAKAAAEALEAEGKPAAVVITGSLNLLEELYKTTF